MSTPLKIGAVALLLLLATIITPFTPFGNSLLKPYVQQKINESSPLPLELSRFELGISNFNLELKGKESLLASITGDYSLLSRTLDALLSLDVKDLSYISEIAATPLQGAFTLNAKASGNMDKLSIVGDSNIAQSDTKFIITLKNLALDSIVANIKQARLEMLLQTIGKPVYAKALIDLDAKVDGTKDNGFKGDVELLVNGGEAVRDVIRDEFNITIPSTLFSLKMTTAFSGDNVAHQIKLASNLGNITSSGATNLKTLATDSLYSIDFSDLSPLTPLAGIPLRGNLKADGTLKGDRRSLVLDGTTNLANSDSSYLVRFSNLSPTTADIKVDNLKLERLLYMMHKPIYLAGDLNLNATLKDLLDEISGEIKLLIPSALTNHEAIKHDFDISLPQNKLSLSSTATLHKGKGEISSVLDSAILKLNAPKSEIVLKPEFALNAPYELQLPDLSLLHSITGRKLNGSINANGKVVNDKNGLLIDFVSQILGGNINGELKNNTLTVEAKQIEVLELLKLGNYPMIFTSKADASLTYDTLAHKGDLNLLAKDGRFAENQLSQILKPLFGIDLAHEIYEKTELSSVINSGEIRSNLTMNSKNSEITTQNTLTDINKNLIDATLNAKIKNRSAILTLNGALDKPKISLNTQGLLKEKADRAIDKHLDKHLPEKAKEPIKTLLKGLF
ncbi:MAG: hypothetical protein ACTTJS_00545 [Wolinella sp.]